jgi:hypothetical protein
MGRVRGSAGVMETFGFAGAEVFEIAKKIACIAARMIRY